MTRGRRIRDAGDRRGVGSKIARRIDHFDSGPIQATDANAAIAVDRCSAGKACLAALSKAEPW
jgi:hypothetical protein